MLLFSSVLAAGCDSAQTCLHEGIAHEYGRDRSKSLADAAKAYAAACEHGSPAGCTSIGVLTSRGQGTPADAARALTFFEKGCAAGDGRGCWHRGKRAQGAKAKTWFDRACKLDYKDGCLVYADLLEDEGEIDAALKIYQEICDSKYANGCTALGHMYEDGLGVAVTPVKAVELYGIGCRHGDPLGCALLGDLYKEGVGVTRDLGQAATLYRKACDANALDGCASLGAMVLSKRLEAPPSEALTALTKGCEGKHARSCSNLGVMHERGLGTAKDLNRAVALYTKGCQGDHAMGCTNLGLIRAQGLAGPKDVRAARQAFEKGCKLGDRGACEHRERSW